MTDHSTTPLEYTPLHAWHVQHGARMAPFAGWDMPIQYAGIIAEHQHTRTQASIFDICHMGELIIAGAGAKEALSRATTHNLDSLQPGRCRYGFILTETGGIIDDCIVYCRGEDDYMIVVNGARVEADKAALVSRLPEGVALTDISAQTAKIDLQGPLAVDVLEALLGKPMRDMPYFAFRGEPWNGTELIVSRTGYTGELGYELYLPWDRAVDLWEALLKDERVKPTGLGARDTLRLESGLPLYGQDLDEAHTPVEAGYEAMLTSTADYVGKNALSRVTQRLIGLTLEGRRSARHEDAVCLPDGREVGVVTSGSFVPTLGHAVAFAWVAADAAEADSYIIRAARTELPAKRAVPPFYTGTARKKLS